MANLSTYLKDEYGETFYELTDFIDASFSVSDIRDKLKEYMPDVYRILFITKYHALPLEIGHNLKPIVGWRLLLGR